MAGKPELPIFHGQLAADKQRCLMPHFIVDNGRVDLHYKMVGDPNAPNKVLFIQGLNTPMGSWVKQVEFFSTKRDYQLCLVDNRGVGQSSAPVGFYSAAQMAKDCFELVDLRLKWQYLHLVGLSMGGMIALELSLLLLERLLSLTLMVTHAGGFSSIIPMAPLLSAFSYRPNMAAEEYADWLLPLMYSKKWRNQYYVDAAGVATLKMNGEVAKQELVALRKRNPEKFVGLIGQLMAVITHYVSTANLEKIRESRVPIMIMTGTKDKLVRPENSMNLHQQLQADEFILFEGAGHMIHRERYQEVNSALWRHFEVHKNRMAKL